MARKIPIVNSDKFAIVNDAEFRNEQDAAIAYDNAAKKLFGEFACLNIS